MNNKDKKTKRGMFFGGGEKGGGGGGGGGGELSLVSRRQSFQNKRLIHNEKQISKFGTSNPCNTYIYACSGKYSVSTI